MPDNIINNKSMDFAVRIVELYNSMLENKKERILATQILRSGTSIGANVRESINAASKKDFVNKMNIALKEANETEYWLELLYKTKQLNMREFESIMQDCKEIVKILVAIIKKAKTTIEN